MSNDNFYGNNQGGDDWSSNPYDSSAQNQYQNLSPHHMPPPAMHPLANNAFDFSYFIETLKQAAIGAKEGKIIHALVILTTLGLAWSLLTGLVQSAVSIFSLGAAGIIGLIMTLMGLVLIPLSFVIHSYQMALLKPAADQLYSPQPGGSPVEVLKSAMPSLLKSMLAAFLYFFAVGLGILFCVLPGLAAAFLFYQVPYLVIVHDRPIPDAFQESFERAKTHWHVFVMALALSFAVSIAAGAITGMMSLVVTLAGGFFPPAAYLGMPIINWIFTAIISVISILLMTIAGTTIDELEGIRAPRT